MITKTQWSQNATGHRKNSAHRDIYNNKILPQEIRKNSNKKPVVTLKATRETNITQNQQKEKNHEAQSISK